LLFSILLSLDFINGLDDIFSSGIEVVLSFKVLNPDNETVSPSLGGL
jgi:hypothetical protein